MGQSAAQNGEKEANGTWMAGEAMISAEMGGVRCEGAEELGRCRGWPEATSRVASDREKRNWHAAYRTLGN